MKATAFSPFRGLSEHSSFARVFRQHIRLKHIRRQILLYTPSCIIVSVDESLKLNLRKARIHRRKPQASSDRHEQKAENAVKTQNGTGPTVYIPPEVYAQIMAYVNATRNEEISGVGTVRVVNPNVLIVEQIFLVDQDCSASETDLDPEALGEFLGDFMTNGGDPEALKLWWHSHAWMDTFWSGTDDQTIAKEFSYTGWLLSLVFNKRGDLLGRLDTFQPVRLTVDSLTVRVLPINDAEMIAATKAEVAAKVRVFKRDKDGVKIYADELASSSHVHVVRNGSGRTVSPSARSR